MEKYRLRLLLLIPATMVLAYIGFMLTIHHAAHLHAIALEEESKTAPGKP